MGLSIFDEYAPFLTFGSFSIGNGTTVADQVPAQLGPVRVDSVLVRTDSVVDVTLNVYLNYGGTQAFIGTVKVPALSGNGTIPLVDVIPALFSVAIGGVVLPAGARLQIGLGANLTGAYTVNVSCYGGAL